MCWLSGKEAARSAWSEECKGRKPCREDYAGRVVGRDCKGTQESARACMAGGWKKCNEWGCAGAQRHTWTEGWKGVWDTEGMGMQGCRAMHSWRMVQGRLMQGRTE